ncbi:Cyclodextrin-binding protein precursor [compost metagenome]
MERIEVFMNIGPKASRKTFRHRLNRMTDRLRDEIRNGTYKSGDYLPSETFLVKEFQLSNKSVRKGLDQLIGEGLIIKVDRVGSQVTSMASAAATVITMGLYTSIERDLNLSFLLKDFHSLHPDIQVKTVLMPTDSMSTASEYLQKGIIDVLMINNMDFTASVEKGYIPMLEPIAADLEMYSITNDAFSTGGRQYAKPIVFSPILLAYNTDHFREANVPEPDGSWTWHDATRYAAALSIPGQRHGLYFYLLSENRWPAFLLQSGMRFESDEQGFIQLAGTRMLEIMRFCRELIYDRSIFPNYLSENSNDVNELFIQGKVSMIMTNYMTLNEFKNADLNYNISPLPYLYEPRSLLNVIGVALNKASKEKDAARLLVDYLASPQAQQHIRNSTLSLPARKSVAESPIAKEDSLNRPSRYFLFRETMFSYRLHRELNLSIKSFHTLKQLLKKYWSCLIDEEELCLLASQQLQVAKSDLPD